MMLHLHFGHRRVEQLEGLVADFCPICRTIRVFDFFRVARVFHCMGITLGRGTPLSYFAKCQECSFELQTDPRRYHSIAQKSVKFKSQEEVVAMTYPTLRTVFADRLALEEMVRKSPSSLDKPVRRRLLLEPFEHINPVVEKHFSGQTPLDLPSGIGCLATILLPAGCLALSIIYARSGLGDEFLLAALLAGLVCLTYALYQLYRRPFRYLNRRLVPMLVRALKPLQPTRDEVAACLEDCKRRSLKIGKVTDLDAVWTPLERRLAGFDH